MRTRLISFILAANLLCAVSLAQFDFGGGSTSASAPSKPWQSFKLNPKTRIKLDFKNASTGMVLQVLSKASGITILKDPSLNGPISLSTPAPVPLEEAFEIVDTALGLKNYALQKEGNLLVVRQKQQRGEDRGANMFGGMNPDQLKDMFSGSRTSLQLYSLTYANASQVARVINDVFAQTSDPFMDMIQQFMGVQQPQTQTAGRVPGGV